MSDDDPEWWRFEALTAPPANADPWSGLSPELRERIHRQSEAERVCDGGLDEKDLEAAFELGFREPPGPTADRAARMMGRDPWPADAPVDLIHLHDRISRRDYRALLCRLLTAPSMSRAWRALDKRIRSRNVPSREAYQRLWGAINYSWVQANRNSGPRDRGKLSYDDERREYSRKVAEDASKLADLLFDCPFDLCAHELYPSEVIELSRVVSLQESSSGPQPQSNLVHRQSLEWTTISELLNELAERARKEAGRSKIVGKWTVEFQFNYFIRVLACRFASLLGSPMAATLAAIATVVLDRDDANAWTDEEVKRALRPGKRGDKRAK